ncbi:aldehyde dehydrogenase family protein [Amnibacterium flavum]|uniref:Aldehyde dehydrogenase n=1 Tax=Amnibacterium flavum TaxID=2173173 RepID=A0A2V1HZ73_9MICO|nr:aldehyde dehydrogenase family protein [Amnibacterium flavum]PVZ95964.1 aldehyde dehydrogenase [Amnibacterium flavum]
MTSITLINPADETMIGEVDLNSVDEVDAAVAKAVVAQRLWAALAPSERAGALRAFAAAVDLDIEHLARLEVENSGHPIASARWEAGHVRDVLTYYSAAPERLLGSQIPVAGGLDITFHEPIGVVGIIVPWNFPMTIAAWGFAPALAAGNAVILKPAEWTPLTALRLGELARRSGLPEGLFTVLPGRGDVVGTRFVTHPDIRKVVFTGSTAVGKKVMAGCAEQVKRVTLELGGKSANIVFADADLELAATSAPGAVFDNSGQDCCARSRILVERSVFTRFLEKFEVAVGRFRVGDPLHDATQMGPLVSAAHFDRVGSFLDGVDVAFTGAAPSGPGYWMPPTVVLPKSLDDRIVREEVFGPVVAVIPFDTEEDAIRIANATEYGLAGSIFTQNLSRGIRVSRAVQAGNLSVNSHSSVRYSTPFGGVKQSGLGRELGPDAPFAFTETKNVFYAT